MDGSDGRSRETVSATDKEKSGSAAIDPACLRFSEVLAHAMGAAGRPWLDSLRTDVGRGKASIAERARVRLAERDLRRQENLEEIFSLAMTMLKEQAGEGRIDADWCARFVEASADSGDRACQEMWAALLTLEVEEPGAVPFVALRTMSGLSRRMIKWVLLLARYRINNFVVRLSDEFFGERGLTGDCILLLEEYGLLRTNRDLSKVFTSQKEGSFITNLLYADKVIRVSHDDPGADLTLPCYRLSESGTALVRAASRLAPVDADVDYMIEIVKLVQKQGYTVAQADIISRSAENVVSKHTPFCELRTLTRAR